MKEPISDGEIAHIFGGLVDREKDPDGAGRLLEEIDRRLAAGEPIPHDSHLADFFHWSMQRLRRGNRAEDAFGLTRPPGRQGRNMERDHLIAFLVQRRIDSGKYDSEDAAALAVRDAMADSEPDFDLSYDRIRNIYRDLKGDPIVAAASKL